MKQENYNRLLKWGGLAVVGLIISPIIFMMIKGLVGLGVALLLSAVIYTYLPALAQWATQTKYGALRSIVSRAPVDALIARANERWRLLSEQAELLKQQAAQLQHFKTRVRSFVGNFPEERQSMEEKLQAYERLFALRTDMFKKARADTEAFMKKVDKAEAVYQMAMADAELSKSFGKQRDFDAFFKEKVAFEAVDEASANSLASLQMALLDEELDKKVDAPVHAINYDSNNRVLTGDILEVRAEVPR